MPPGGAPHSPVVLPGRLWVLLLCGEHRPQRPSGGSPLAWGAGLRGGPRAETRVGAATDAHGARVLHVGAGSLVPPGPEAGTEGGGARARLGGAHFGGRPPELRIGLAVLILLRRLRAGRRGLLPHDGLLGVLLAVQAGALGQAHPPHHLPGRGRAGGVEGGDTAFPADSAPSSSGLVGLPADISRDKARGRAQGARGGERGAEGSGVGCWAGPRGPGGRGGHLPPAAGARGASTQQRTLAALGAQERVVLVFQLQQLGPHLLVPAHV